MPASLIEQTVAKLKGLPAERVAEVADFVDFLIQRDQRVAVSKSSGAAWNFPVISVGRWPDDVPTRREELYDDSGR